MTHNRLFVLGLALASFACAALAQDAPPDDTVVANVNGEAIRYADVVRAHERLPDQYRQVPIEMLFTALVDQLVNSKLLMEQGRKLNLENDENVRRQVLRFEEFAIQQAYIERHIEENVTDELLQARYEETIAAQPRDEEIHARHILVETEETAAELIVQLRDGADFQALARERSTGPSGSNGGDLGYFSSEQMVPEFSAAASALETGAYSQVPVQTQFGWHIILVEDRRAVPPPEFETMREQLKSELSNELVTAHLAALSEQAVIERFNVDGTPLPAAEGVR